MRARSSSSSLLCLLAVAVVGVPRAFAGSPPPSVPTWLQAQVGESGGRIAQTVLEWARALYRRKVTEGVGQPSIEGGDDAGLSLCAAAASANDPTEPTAEVDDLGSLVILQHACSGGVGIELIRLAQEMPRQLLR